ncbi:MAG: hypothetical protein L3J74_03820 [Bacteroidales bacterium]|nr:hypothetical protein [Bacteroidales bacterium]
MIFLILSIISSSFIYIIFKLLDTYRIKIFPVIVINYITASITGYFLIGNNFSLQTMLESNWIYVSAIIGVLFILTFYLIGISSKNAGITITSISTKMSVVFPILFSLFYYGEQIYLLKTLGILLALLSIILSSIKNKDEKGNKKYLFPLILFLGMGLVDSLVKFNQQEFLQNTGVATSTTFVFIVAAMVSSVFFLISNFKQIHKLNLKTLIAGLLLGISNFGSLYFLILALNHGIFESSVIFAFNNSAIIMISVLAGRFFFKEKLLLINWLGVIVSLAAIVALSL